MSPQEAEALINKYSMRPHEEGGYYCEIWRKPAEDKKPCSLSHIYYLLMAGESARWHRVTSDEIWLFHQGAPLTISLGGNGERPQETSTAIIVGRDVFHCLIPGGTWQKAEAKEGAVLVSCVVSPGFDVKNWEMI